MLSCTNIHPLIPANAGTQIQPEPLGFIRETPPYDLGPGIRRDERIKGVSKSEA